jgi:hypothetical protein
MKSFFYVTLVMGKFFPNNIHRANYHFTHSKKLKQTDNTTVLPLDGIVYRKRPLISNIHNYTVLTKEHNEEILARHFTRLLYFH